MRIYLLMFGMSVLSLLGIFFLLYSIFIDGHYLNRPVEINNSELPADLEQDWYAKGEMVRAYYDFCKLRDIPASVQWVLIDTYLRTYPVRDVATIEGCHKSWVDVEHIPPDVLPGLYRFEGLVTYQINAYNEVVIPLKTESFYVR